MIYKAPKSQKESGRISSLLLKLQRVKSDLNFEPSVFKIIHETKCKP